MKHGAVLLLALAAGGSALSGCVAVAVPVVAGAAVGKRTLDKRSARADRLKVIPLPPGSAMPTPVADTVEPISPGIQYLYGSGEAAAVSVQAWRELVRYVAAKVVTRPAESVMLAPGATLVEPRFEPCGSKPLAAVFDVDETVLLNLGFEYDAAKGAPFSEARWAEWERSGIAKVAPVPGAVKALEALRAMGLTVVFNTNRSATNVAATEAALAGAGLGRAMHGETLFLSGDDATGSKKDARRATIAARYCVIALGGDQLGDFSDLFNAGLAPTARRSAALAAPLSAKWGAGWFVLPNPAYGSALKGNADEIFAPDTRWTPAP